MEPLCEIKFTTTRSKTDLNADKTCYQGQLRHNIVRFLKETRKAFAEYCGEPESKTGRYIDSLGEFIAQEVAAGHRLNFGPFDVSLKMLGGFQGRKLTVRREGRFYIRRISDQTSPLGESARRWPCPARP